MPRYEVIPARLWRNRVTGATASVYGALPWTSEADKSNWEMASVGWTIRDNRDNTVGLGHKPWGTATAAQAFIDTKLQPPPPTC